MDTAIISIVEDETIADQVVDALRKDGFEGKSVRIMNKVADDLLRELGEQGFDKEDAQGFADAVEQGKKLVAVRVPQENADRAASIMERFEQMSNESGQPDIQEQSVPIVEESLSVGKTKSATGGVRVTSKVTERPVEETVTLREEHVEAVERPADRVLKSDDVASAFEEKTIEMMGVKEEAAVTKEARVVGEVLITKETTENESKIKDTVRKTNVDVEEIDTGSKKRK